MPLYRVTLAYDGTDYSGWQIQPPVKGVPRPTVQGVLEAALRRLAAEKAVRVAAAGRTDAGVHALGQVATFELDRDLSGEDLVRALNGLLPGDVRALEAGRPPEGFHARRSALSKHYRYVLDTGPIRIPTRRRNAGHVPFTLDPAAVQEAAALYGGRHDFASLAAAGGSVKTTERTIFRSEARFEGTTLAYDVEADGFLRQMVRNLVGGLVAVGRGDRSVEDLRRALEARDRRAWPPPVEACGLTLVRVNYSTPGTVLT